MSIERRNAHNVKYAGLNPVLATNLISKKLVVTRIMADKLSGFRSPDVKEKTVQFQTLVGACACRDHG